MTFDIKDWYDKKINNNTLFSYKGTLTSEKITFFLDEIEKKILLIEENVVTKRKIYNVLVESLQNLFHHAEVVSKDLEYLLDVKDNSNVSKFGIIIFQRKNNGYSLITANLVRNYKIRLIKDKIDQINALSPEEVKALYKLVLNNHEFSERGGGGLGLIDIVKRTGSKLVYDFIDYNKESSFYSLEVNV